MRIALKAEEIVKDIEELPNAETAILVEAAQFEGACR
jgi:hypothetical protein